MLLRIVRLHIIIVNEEQKKAFLIDVACLCDHPENVIVARGWKQEKYAAIKEQLEGKWLQKCVVKFIVGSLGTYIGP